MDMWLLIKRCENADYKIFYFSFMEFKVHSKYCNWKIETYFLFKYTIYRFTKVSRKREEMLLETDYYNIKGGRVNGMVEKNQCSH
jgi:hypothetical protein